MRPQPPLLAGASVRRPSAFCPGEWQEALSLPNLRAEHPLVALPMSGDLFICARDLLVEAIAPQPPAPLNLMRALGDRRQWGGSEDVERSMSDEFDGLDATEKAAAEVALIRSRTLAGVRSHHLVGEAVEPPQRLRLMPVKQSKTQKYL